MSWVCSGAGKDKQITKTARGQQSAASTAWPAGRKPASLSLTLSQRPEHLPVDAANLPGVSRLWPALSPRVGVPGLPFSYKAPLLLGCQTLVLLLLCFTCSASYTSLRPSPIPSRSTASPAANVTMAPKIAIVFVSLLPPYPSPSNSLPRHAFCCRP